MLYTGHGDAGYTSVIGGPALPKCHLRLEALGALDEAQAQLGLARALLISTPWATAIFRIQADLHLLMAEVATVAHGSTNGHYLTDAHLLALEADLATWDQLTGGFTGFSIPGDSIPGAHLNLARTVIRRAEREVVSLHSDGQPINALTLTYLNRLSSWVYALALVLERNPAGITEPVAA